MNEVVNVPAQQSAVTIERRNGELEIQDWKAALDWLAGKCTFCAGRGFGGVYLRHTLRQCKRGGAKQVEGGLGRRFYDVTSLPWSGCQVCCMPSDFCLRWGSKDHYWPKSKPRTDECKYGKYLLRDGIIGFLSCGVQQYMTDDFDGLAEYCERERKKQPPYDDASAVWWLMQQLVVEEVEATEMLRQLSIWTRDLQGYKSQVIELKDR